MLLLYRLIASLTSKYVKNDTNAITIAKINNVITVAENAGLKERRFFIKLYTGYIIKDTANPIINGKKYINSDFMIKNKTL